MTTEKQSPIKLEKDSLPDMAKICQDLGDLGEAWDREAERGLRELISRRNKKKSFGGSGRWL